MSKDFQPRESRLEELQELARRKYRQNRTFRFENVLVPTHDQRRIVISRESKQVVVLRVAARRWNIRGIRLHHHQALEEGHELSPFLFRYVLSQPRSQENVLNLRE